MVEKILEESSVYRKLRGTIAERNMAISKGDTYKFLTATEGTAQSVTAYSDYTIIDSALTADTLTLNTTSGYAFNMSKRDMDHHQAAGSIIDTYVKIAAKVMTRDIEGKFFSAYASALTDFDAGNIGGSSGTKITWSAANVDDVYTEASALVSSQTGVPGQYALVITPKQYAKIAQSGFAVASRTADDIFSRGLKIGQNGFSGNFFGVDTYVSHNLNHEVAYTLSDAGSDGETFVISTNAGSVTFTLQSTPAAANDVDVGGSATATAANLAAAINQGAGAGSAYIAASAADARKLRGLTATSSGALLTIVSKYGQMTISTTIANTNTQAQFVHNYFGEYEAIELAHPAGITTLDTQEPRQQTKNYLSEVFFGSLVPTNNTHKFLDVQILV